MLQEYGDVITDWSIHNDMRINARKAKEMIICFCRNDNHVTSIPRNSIDANDIGRAHKPKYNGISLYGHLTSKVTTTIQPFMLIPKLVSTVQRIEPSVLQYGHLLIIKVTFAQSRV